MARVPTPEEAIERAQRAQDERMQSIRALAIARQNVVDAREQAERDRAEQEARIAERVGEAEREDVKAYGGATGAGWSADELRKIGFSEPDKKARTQRRSARKSGPRRTSDRDAAASESEIQAEIEAEIQATDQQESINA